MKITRKQLRKIISEQFSGDPGPTATKILDSMVDGLEKKLMSMRLDEDQIDEMLIEFMQTVGTDIEKMLTRLLEGGYSADY